MSGDVVDYYHAEGCPCDCESSIGEKIRIHANDWLIKTADGFLYRDSYGEETALDNQTIWTWLADEQIDVTEDIERFIND